MGKWTRRAFITAGTLVGGGLLVAVGTGIAIRPGHRTPKLAKLVEGKDEVLINAWIKILPDNGIRVIVPHAEMGQGAHTALPLMLADEMDADWSKVSMEEAPAHPEYANFHTAREFLLPGEVPGFVEDTLNGAFLTLAGSLSMQTTGGSFSVRATGQRGMRVGGAAARELLVNAAATQWNVPSDEVYAKDSYLFHDASGRSAPFVDFAEAAASQRGPISPKLKNPDEFKLMGNHVPRLDIPSKVNGTAVFGVDVNLPGMKYGAVKTAGVFGSKVRSFDAAAAKQSPGVLEVVNLGTGVGVIADSYWQARKALAKIEVEYTTGDADRLDSDSIFDQFARDMDTALKNGSEQSDHAVGDARQVLSDADEVIEVEYKVPYLAHATMEPMNCTALVKGDRVEIWAGLQNPLGTRDHIAERFEYAPENVTVNNCYLGGGFGRRARPDYPEQGVQLAKAVPGTPVKMIWSREQDIQQDHYRPAVVSRFRASLDKDGVPQAWENQFVDKHEPVEATLIPYHVANQYIHYADSPTHVPFGAWRAVDHSQHAFFTESFIDELAHKAGRDPYQYRHSLLEHDPRAQKVLDAVAKLSNWGKSMPDGWGQGIALHKSFNTVVAQVVDIDMTGSEPRVHDVYCVADPGFAVSPDGFKAQIESGIIFGLTAVIYGEVSLKNGAVMQSNFHDYKMIRMNTAPDIHIEVINSGNVLGGGGEPGTPPVAPAVCNALYAAKQVRIRKLPVSKQLASLRI